MKKLLALFLLPAMLLAGCSRDEVTPDTAPPVVQEPQTVAEQLANATWETRKVSESITWKYKRFEDLFNSNQSLTILEIDLSDESVQVDLPYVTSGFLKTSEGAANVRATAAINGSYFDTSKGGSTVFFKKDGEVINTTRSGFTTYRENAGFAIGADGSISIVKKPTAGWSSVQEVNTLLASGPLLVYDKALVNQVQEAFNTNRHPRTAVGLTADKRLIAVVVDGRFTEAHGMTTEELATVMQALGCVEAMNLDGGGSSTAWVRNRGVVNYPSDNKKYDHEGERGVATVLAFVEN
ncbi:phosphodiester glycosidase family protein [Pontibacter litorisediminis]|uniref:phosphodiester glycosidase family protein n=1 Tax=Pontibacter litorisediminis TaxID=1846260 RepID=UPI0023EBD94D|nr:phosphodiester glycosidase family protein [Pontibacter litorisediminis]